jgi:hypothetical protein
MAKVALLLALYLLPADAATYCANNADYVRGVEFKEHCICADATEDEDICTNMLDGQFYEDGVCFDSKAPDAGDVTTFDSQSRSPSKSDCEADGKIWVTCVSDCPGTQDTELVTEAECEAAAEKSKGFSYKSSSCEELAYQGFWFGLELTNPDEDDCDDLENAGLCLPDYTPVSTSADCEGDTMIPVFGMMFEEKMKACCPGEALACDIEANNAFPSMNFCSNPDDFESSTPFSSSMFGYDKDGYACDNAYHEDGEDCGDCEKEGENECKCDSEQSCEDQRGTWKQTTCGVLGLGLMAIKDPDTPLSEYNKDNCPLQGDVDISMMDWYFSAAAETCCGPDYDELGDHICDRDEDWSEELDSFEGDDSYSYDFILALPDDDSVSISAMQAVTLLIVAAVAML